jgi:programmed cell death protein 5
MNEEISQEDLVRIEAMKKEVLRKVLSKPALERLSRIRLVKPDLSNQLELYLVQLYQTGKLKSEISDEQLKSILEALTAKKQYNVIR